MNRLRAAVRSTTLEDRCVALLGASFFIGIWYAFPMVNTSTDVWPLGGGVLRAIEAHTLLPGYGVAYGTLSFYQNYVAMILALIAGYVALGFDLEALKTFLILNPFYSLLVPRLVSATTAVVFLVIVYRFLKTRVESAPWRFTLLMLVFGNVLAALLVRSGKMWMLSMLLAIVSFIYLYRAITEEGGGIPGRAAFMSVFAAFLAAANFAFFALFLINIPILLYVFPKTRDVFKRIVLIILPGAVVFLAIFALNATNIIGQVSGFVLQFFNATSESAVHAARTPVEAFVVKARHAIESFPLLLLALVPAISRGIRDTVLANLAVLYIVLYMIAVSLVFRTDDALALNIRHIFPVGFFLMFFLVACKPPARWVVISFCTAGCILYAYTVVLFSIPTTYNAAYDFIETRYANEDVRIDESIFELTLPMNKASYALYARASCGSTCQHVQTLPNDIAFRPLVVTSDTDPAALVRLPESDLLVVEREIPGCTPLARFENGTKYAFDIDINLGRMLMPAWYELHTLGKNIYIYETRGCSLNS